MIYCKVYKSGLIYLQNTEMRNLMYKITGEKQIRSHFQGIGEV